MTTPSLDDRELDTILDNLVLAWSVASSLPARGKVTLEAKAALQAWKQRAVVAGRIKEVERFARKYRPIPKLSMNRHE